MKLPTLITIPDLDGVQFVCLAVSREPDAMDGVFILFSPIALTDFGKDRLLRVEDIIAEFFVTPDLLDSGHWQPFQGHYDPALMSSVLLSKSRENSFIGAKIIGSGITMRLLSAVQGKVDWDEMYDPRYYENLILPRARNDFRISRRFKHETAQPRVQ